jgi:hypothetical protein
MPKSFEEMFYRSKNMSALCNALFDDDKYGGRKDEKILYKDAHHISVSAGETISYYLEGEILNAIEGSRTVLETAGE